jgi:hypothetical protein
MLAACMQHGTSPLAIISIMKAAADKSNGKRRRRADEEEKVDHPVEAKDEETKVLYSCQHEGTVACLCDVSCGCGWLGC